MLRGLALLLVVGLVGCNGNIGDLFSVFPASAFEDPDGGEDPGGIPGAFEPVEVAFLGSAQGVTGDVRNIAVATIAGESYAFLAAGVDGVHMVDVSEPSTVSATDFITTIDDDVLSDAAASIAGGRVDDVAVIDNAFLVCVAIGTGATNAVTVFNIADLITLATSSSADLSDAFVPGTGAIAADGTPNGNGGDVDGGANVFLVATGGSELGAGLITPGSPGTWAALPPTTDATIDNFIDVKLRLPTAAYCVVAQGDDLRLATFTVEFLPNPGVTLTGDLQALTGSFSGLDDNAAAFPGTFPAALALDLTGTLYASGQNDIRTYSVANPTLPVEGTPIFATGFEVGGMAADIGFLVYTNSPSTITLTSLAGTITPLSTFEAPGRRTLGVALRNTDTGRFALTCANNVGFRIVQYSDLP
ncbi:MAG: hypothetical protein AAGD14_13025 [Planctomycetota bacterium]